MSGAATATFVYDGDGNRVKGTASGVTTTYVGNYYEWSGSTATSYYYAGSLRVAMRQGSTLSYLFADQLGSTSVVANSSGSKTAEVRYKAWGEDRYTSGTAPTSYRYTGQRVETTIGLYYYGARWYDSSLGRFVQADTVVPSTGDPQAWDRYAYVDNNPAKFVDPTGHRPVEDDKLPPSTPTPNPTLTSIHATQTQQSQNPLLQRNLPEKICTVPPITPQIYNPAPTATPTPKPLTWDDIDKGIDYLTKPDFGPGIEEYAPNLPQYGLFNPKPILQGYRIIKDTIWIVKELIKTAVSTIYK